MNPQQLESFERSFRDHTSTCRMTCHCGKIYFDDVNGGISWGKGELEELENGKGIPAGGSIGLITFEGRYFADACTCWHERAAKIVNFIEQHGQAIADYFTAEKARKVAEADRSQVVT